MVILCNVDKFCSINSYMFFADSIPKNVISIRNSKYVIAIITGLIGFGMYESNAIQFGMESTTITTTIYNCTVL